VLVQTPAAADVAAFNDCSGNIPAAKSRAGCQDLRALPLVQVAIDLVPGSPGVSADATNQTAAYGLSVIKARMIPDDIGAPDFHLTLEALAKAKMQDIQIAVGTITGQ